MRAVLLAAALLLAPAAQTHAAKRSPSVRVVDTSPLTVRGADFRARERVVVTLRRDRLALATRSLRTGATGGFVVSFAAVTLHRCDGGATITAVSASGATAKTRLPQPACPPSLGIP